MFLVCCQDDSEGEDFDPSDDDDDDDEGEDEEGDEDEVAEVGELDDVPDDGNCSFHSVLCVMSCKLAQMGSRPFTFLRL